MASSTTSSRWLVVSVVALLLTPFVTFPEIMGDAGPRTVPLWRNVLGCMMLVLSIFAILWTSLAVLRERRRRRTKLVV